MLDKAKFCFVIEINRLHLSFDHGQVDIVVFFFLVETNMNNY